MSETELDVVTGAFSYTGGAIASHLVAKGRRVRTLTGHPHRRSPLHGAIQALPYRFDDADALARSLEGASVLYNTYWVRFDRPPITFARAIENSRRLFAAAERVGIRRVVHVSVTNPSTDSPFPYFRGKAAVERILGEVASSYAVVRPSVVFGPGDILMNNIAWLLRRFPVFAIPGSGAYPVRPVHVDDVADLCVRTAEASHNVVVDAVGPDTMTFEEMVLRIRRAVGSRSAIVHVSPRVAMTLARGIGRLVSDVIVTDHELGGLMAGLATATAPSAGSLRFSDWIEAAGPEIGHRYESEIRRHFSRERGA